MTASERLPAQSNEPASNAPSLDELIRRRDALQLSLAVHEASIRSFWPGDRPAFKIQLEEDLAADTKSGKPDHLTSTASCFESLADLRPGLSGALPAHDDGPVQWRDLAGEYAARALACGPTDWTSDGQAHVYSRVRALPAILRFVPQELASEMGDNARDRLREAFAVIDDTRPPVERGIGERVLGEDGSPEQEKAGERYPANAFHAYWGLRADREFQELSGLDPRWGALDEHHSERVGQNEAWANAAIGRHIALLAVGSRRGDAQQLAYALLADLLRHRGRLAPASGQHDLYQAALGAFFRAQEPSGRWPQSLPLFHYPISGNAYCYTFETLTELLRPALAREEGRTYRKLLEPYLPNLMLAWDYAMRTRVPLDEVRGDTFGWSSAHHIARDAPEAWATAAVFSFGQLLRCMAGHVVAERAAVDLGVRRPGHADPEAAERSLADRGDTWSPSNWTVGRQLASLFLHPARAPRPEPGDYALRDPDAPLLGATHARSAVLFGPPGTGKTSIVEALAGTLGWQFVEVLASDFLSRGVDSVPAQADRIFERLMQLDRCVVLFDEIDELIQDRSGGDSDPFGRFLTTSMLPKIAKLWDQRRLLFFVATNHVSRADPAITRSSRFDARIFVSPPSLAVKRDQLTKQMENIPQFEEAKISAALAGDGDELNKLTPDEHALAVLPLLRFDQMPELARRIRGKPGNGDAFEAALGDMRKELLAHEWQPAKEPPDWGEKDDAAKLRYVYDEYRKEETRDFSRDRVLRMAPEGGEIPAGLEQITGDHRSPGSGSDRFFSMPDDLSVFGISDGLMCLGGDPPLEDGHLLWFRAPGR